MIALLFIDACGLIAAVCWMYWMRRCKRAEAKAERYRRAILKIHLGCLCKEITKDDLRQDCEKILNDEHLDEWRRG